MKQKIRGLFLDKILIKLKLNITSRVYILYRLHWFKPASKHVVNDYSVLYIGKTRTQDT